VKILLIPGDGVGSELAAEVHKLISTIQSVFNIKISTQTLDIGETHFQETNILIPKVMDQMGSEADSIWLGPITNQSKLKAYNRNKIVQEICSNQGFEFYYRHFRPLASLQEIQSDNLIDVLLIENNFYSHTVASELPASFVSEKKLDVMTTYYSQNHLESIFAEAERLLKEGVRHKLQIVLPDELRQRESPWVLPASQLADLGYNVQWSSVDQFFYHLLRTPDQYDLVLTVSPFGRIFSKLVSAIEGGLGNAYEYHRSTDNKSMFHILHPSSRRFVGRDASNPIGAILSIAEFMNGQKKPTISKAIRVTVEEAINAGWVTRDLGGSMGTIEMGDFICSKLSENIAIS
jgi:3-isopropylmalate dehydrogenase|tara:strand:- start:6725 stop:7768 length:1044 start_codon:yes stop_codon:yes gene_type:complete